MLGEVGLPGPIRSQHGAYAVHPALLDACFQSVAAPSGAGSRQRRSAAAIGRGPIRATVPPAPRVLRLYEAGHGPIWPGWRRTSCSTSAGAPCADCNWDPESVNRDQGAERAAADRRVEAANAAGCGRWERAC